MTVAKMHKQRKVVRGRYIPRFSRQRKIKRGGGDPGGTAPVVGTPVLTEIDPTAVSQNQGATLFTLTGSDFAVGCKVSTGAMAIYDLATTRVSASEVTATFVVPDINGEAEFFVKNVPDGVGQAAQKWSNTIFVPIE
jgi:hypothetical protein